MNNCRMVRGAAAPSPCRASQEPCVQIPGGPEPARAPTLLRPWLAGRKSWSGQTLSTSVALLPFPSLPFCLTKLVHKLFIKMRVRPLFSCSVQALQGLLRTRKVTYHGSIVGLVGGRGLERGFDCKPSSGPWLSIAFLSWLD